MSPEWSIFICLLIGLAFLAAELLLPTHGVLGFFGIASVTVGVSFAFQINRWAGLGMVIAIMVLTPFLFNLSIRLWQKTPVGKKMVLTSTVGEAITTSVLIGSLGKALTEMRPTGECEFENKIVQSTSESGQIIPAGAHVRVIAFSSNLATVRQIQI